MACGDVVVVCGRGGGGMQQLYYRQWQLVACGDVVVVSGRGVSGVQWIASDGDGFVVGFIISRGGGGMQ